MPNLVSNNISIIINIYIKEVMKYKRINLIYCNNIYSFLTSELFLYTEITHRRL